MSTIGVDLGGTRIRVGAVDEHNEVILLRELPTRSGRAATEIAADIASLVRVVQTETGMTGGAIGVGVPTTIDSSGRLVACVNLPTCDGYPLAATLGDMLDTVVQMENDARCFALGEWLGGAARGATIAAGVTLGTSIGLGIVMQGKLMRGAHGEAGEIWRSPTDLSGGHVDADLHGLLGGHVLAHDHLDGPGLARRARDGDRAAVELFIRYGERLGAALCWICDLFDPDIMVVGGAVAASFDLFGDRARLTLGTRRASVVVSTLGDRAAILGAAGLVGMET